MPTFPRTVVPTNITRPWLPTGLRDRGHSGIIQVRKTKLVGWSWQETWRLLRARDINDAALIAWVDYAWHSMISFDVTHPTVPGSGIPPLGLGTAGITVTGVGQVGGSLNTTGWPASTNNVARAGDVIKIAGDDAVYQVWEAANSDAGGNATLKVTPDLRKSPADLAAVTTTGVTFKAMIWARSKHEATRSIDYYGNFQVTMTELLS